MTNGIGRKGIWNIAFLACVLLCGWSVSAGAWPVPDSGQTQAYAAGDDGAYSSNPPRSYTINGNGTVTDNVTTLVWQRQDDGQTRTGDEANGYCGSLTLGGTTGWRLPTVQELVSLVDYGRSAPAIDKAIFPGTHPFDYWTSTSLANNSSYRPSVSFEYGYVGNHLKLSSYFVRCVRGEPARLGSPVIWSLITRPRSRIGIPGSPGSGKMTGKRRAGTRP